LRLDSAVEDSKHFGLSAVDGVVPSRKPQAVSVGPYRMANGRYDVVPGHLCALNAERDRPDNTDRGRRAHVEHGMTIGITAKGSPTPSALDGRTCGYENFAFGHDTTSLSLSARTR
jgi:hypothetical protein